MDGRGRRRVVVGIDTVEDSRPAVVWAAREAARRGVELLVVHAEVRPVVGEAVSAAYAAELLEHLDRSAHRQLEAAADLARENSPVAVRTSLVHDRARPALLREARSAELVVTGARRRNHLRAGAFGGFQLGSTSLHLAVRSPVPVVVVRHLALDGRGPEHGVVVGFDGSDGAVPAVRWAARHAVAIGQPLTIVQAWHAPAVSAPEFDPQFHRTVRLETESAARRSSEAAATVARNAAPGVRVWTELVEEAFPADALLTAAGDSCLLVVGSRGRGAFASALLGSVSHDVLHRAGVPVAVVPHEVATAPEHGPRTHPVPQTV